MTLAIKAADLITPKYRGVLMDNDSWPKSMVTVLSGIETFSRKQKSSLYAQAPEIVCRAIVAEAFFETGGLFANYSNKEKWIAFVEAASHSGFDTSTIDAVWKRVAYTLINSIVRAAHNLGLTPEHSNLISREITSLIGLSKKKTALYVPMLRELKAAVHLKYITDSIKDKRIWEIADEVGLSEQRIYGIIKNNRPSK